MRKFLLVPNQRVFPKHKADEHLSAIGIFGKIISHILGQPFSEFHLKHNFNVDDMEVIVRTLVVSQAGV